MGRINFYHTVWRKSPSTGVIQPLQDVQAEVHQIIDGVEAGGTTVAFAGRTGITLADLSTDDRGEVDFWLDPGDYMVHFTDLAIPQRIGDFQVGVSAVSGDNQGILVEQLKLAVQQGIHRPGDLKCVAYSTPDSGWFLCDGSPKSRSTYPDLFAKIGTTYNSGAETSSQFGLPDLRGRVPVGADGAAARLTALDALGNVGGEEKHSLLPAEASIRDHKHSGTTGNENSSLNHNHTTDSQGAHSHGGGTAGSAPGGLGVIAGALTPQVGGNSWSVVPGNWVQDVAFGIGVNNHGHGISVDGAHGHNLSVNSPSAHTHSIASASMSNPADFGPSANGDGHNNMQPFQIFNWMVKF